VLSVLGDRDELSDAGGEVDDTEALEEDLEEEIGLTEEHEGYVPDDYVPDIADEPAQESIIDLPVQEEPVIEIEYLENVDQTAVANDTTPGQQGGLQQLALMAPTFEQTEQSVNNVVAFPQSSVADGQQVIQDENVSFEMPTGKDLYLKFFATFPELKTKGIEHAFYHQSEGQPADAEGFTPRLGTNKWCKRVTLDEMPPAFPLIGLLFLRTNNQNLVHDLNLVERFGFRRSSNGSSSVMGVSLTDSQIMDLLIQALPAVEEIVPDAVNY